MPTLDQHQLADAYSANEEFRKQFERLFSLGYLLQRCIVPNDYAPPTDLGESIILSEEGQSLLDALAPTCTSTTESDARLAIFLEFYHVDLLIDPMRCDADRLDYFLNKEVISGVNLRFPWIYDRELYDRYFELFGDPVDELAYDDTVRLLENTSPGVFQLGNYVTGPFGLLRSAARRYLPATRRVPLWHCSDLACQALHGVELATGRTSLERASRELVAILSRIETEPSEWFTYYRNLIDNEYEWYDDRNSKTLPWLVVNAFSHPELRKLVASIIDHDGGSIRPLLPNSKTFAPLFADSGSRIAHKLSKAQCFQLILLATDGSLVRHIDQLIRDGGLVVPHTEVRHCKFRRHSRTSLDIAAECSRYGIRFDSENRQIAIARFGALIRHLFKDSVSSLEWKLRHVDGESVWEKLDRHLHKESSLSNIVRDLVFNDQTNLRKTLEFVGCDWMDLPRSPDDEAALSETILWKLGFDVSLYPSFQRQFWERLAALRDAAMAHRGSSQCDEEAIRSAAANCFVSFEEILDYALSFSTWMLLSDHFGETFFQFELEHAREFMAEKLAGRTIGSFGVIKLEPARQNTLFPMIHGLALLADACEEVLENQRCFQRPQAEYPGFVGKTLVRPFPFLHTALIADLRPDDRDQVIRLLRGSARSIDSQQICDLRNRLEHKRERFPHESEIIQGCSVIEEVVKSMESAGICPSVYLFARHVSDEFGRGEVTLRNYCGSEVNVPDPSAFSGCRVPGFGCPQIIVPMIHIGDSFEPIRFSFLERSEYGQRWTGYPRRRPSARHGREGESEGGESLSVPETSDFEVELSRRL